MSFTIEGDHKVSFWYDVGMKKTKTTAPIGASLIVLSSIFYASYGIWTKLMGNFFGGYTASALRSILIVIILLPIALAFRKFEPVKWKANWKYIAGITITSFFIWGPLYYAFLHAGIGVTSTINYASIVIGMFFFGWLLAGERFTKNKILSAALGLAGLALIFSPGTSQFGFLALAAAVLSGVSIAGNLVIAKKIPYNTTQTMIISWLASVVANIVMAVLFGETFPAIGLHIEWLYLLLFVVTSVIASGTVIKGIKLIEAGAVGILGLLEIVFGILFGVLFFSERPTAVALIGAAVIILAASIPYVQDYRRLHRGLGGE